MEKKTTIFKKVELVIEGVALITARTAVHLPVAIGAWVADLTEKAVGKSCDAWQNSWKKRMDEWKGDITNNGEVVVEDEDENEEES